MFSRVLRPRLVWCIASIVWPCLTTTALASTFYWDANGGLTGSGNIGGNWSGSNWNIRADGTVNTDVWAGGSGDANFSAGTDGTGSISVNVGTGRTFHNLIIDEGSVYLGNGSLTVFNHPTWTVNTGTYLSVSADIDTASYNLTVQTLGAASISGAISGSGAFIKDGYSTLSLSGNNTYSGGTTLVGGALALNHAGALGSSGTITFNGGVLQFSDANTVDYSSRFNTAPGQFFLFDTNGQNVTLASTIAGSGNSLNKYGSGKLTLAGDNTYSGQTAIVGGTLVVANTYALRNSTLLVSSGSGSVAFDSSVASHSFVFGGLRGNGNVTLADNAATPNAVNLTVGNNNESTTYSGVLSGPGSLTQWGSGVLTLAGANTHSGTTTLNMGTLLLANENALQNSTFYRYFGGSAAFDSSVGGHAFTFGGLRGFGTITLADNSGSPFPVALTVGKNNENTTYAGILTGPGSLTKIGSGTLTLWGQNTYSGLTIVNDGTLVIENGNNSSSYSGGFRVNGGTLQLNSTYQIQDIAPILLTGGRIDLNGKYEVVSSFSISGGTLDGSGGLLTAATYNLMAGTVNGDLGDGTLLKTTAGTVNLYGSSSAGTVNVSEGRLVLGHADALSSSAALTISGSGTLDIGSYNQHVGTFTISSGWLNGTGTLYANSYNVSGGTINAHLGNSGSTVNFTSGSNSINGTSASGSVNVSGAGTTVVLGFDATFTSPTTTFNVASGSTLDTSEVSGGFTVSYGQRLTNNGQVSGSVTTENGGMLNGSGTMSGVVTIGNAGSFSPGNSPGTMNFANGLSFLSGGTYVWEVNKVTSLGGDQSSLKGVDPGFDFANITGALDITGPFTVDITGLGLTNNPGNVSQWNAANSYSWIIATASGGIGGVNNLSLLTSHFVDNNATGGGVNNGFSIAVLGNDLVLSYSPVPEPSTIAMLAGGAVMGLAGVFRRRKPLVASR